jgi:hypothetical protein
MKTESVSEVLADETGCCGCQPEISLHFVTAKGSRHVSISIDVQLFISI